MREIEYRGRSKRTNKWVYGNLIIHKEKTKIQPICGESFKTKYSIQYKNKNGKYATCEVKEDTIGQFLGEGEYGRIYEGMKLYDEYAEENCSIEYLEETCEFRICYDGNTETVEGLAGLIPIEPEE